VLRQPGMGGAGRAGDAAHGNRGGQRARLQPLPRAGAEGALLRRRCHRAWSRSLTGRRAPARPGTRSRRRRPALRRGLLLGRQPVARQEPDLRAPSSEGGVGAKRLFDRRPRAVCQGEADGGGPDLRLEAGVQPAGLLQRVLDELRGPRRHRHHGDHRGVGLGTPRAVQVKVGNKTNAFLFNPFTSNRMGTNTQNDPRPSMPCPVNPTPQRLGDNSERDSTHAMHPRQSTPQCHNQCVSEPPGAEKPEWARLRKGFRECSWDKHRIQQGDVQNRTGGLQAHRAGTGTRPCSTIPPQMSVCL
jgi:hypothetical protein